MYCRVAFDLFCQVLPKLPGNYLEIGVLNGDSVRELALRFPSKIIYAIDPFIDDGNTSWFTHVPEGKPLVEAKANALKNMAGIGNIKFFEQTSRDWSKDKSVADLYEMQLSAVLVDGSHHYPDTSHDLDLSLRCLDRGGLIFADDLHLDDVRRAIEEFCLSQSHRIERRQDQASNCEMWIKPL